MKHLLKLLLLLAAVLPSHAEKVATLPKPTGYIDDYASVLSSSSKSELEAICNEVHDKTKAQVFFVTVKTTEGVEVQTFANQLFHQWKIGEKKTDRGILLLLAINDHKRWIEVGYGLEGILNDAKVGDIGRAMVPDLQASRYDAAARLGILDVSQVIAQDAGVTLDETATEPEQLASTESESQPKADQPLIHNGSPWAFVLFGTLFLGPFIGIILLARYQRKRGVTFGASSGSSSSSSSNDDSFSSSSSSDSSSDFSGGDGGDSGGGGAGGGW